MVLSGNTWVINCSTSSSVRIRKSLGHCYSSWSSQVFGLSFLRTSPSLHPLGLRPVARLQLYPPPPFPPPPLAPYCSPPAVHLRSLYKSLPRLRPSFWPSLRPLWHTPRGPRIRVSSIHYPILPSGTALFPAPLRRAGPHSHFLAQADTRHLSDVIFLCQGFIHFFCSPSRFLQMSLRVLLSFLLASFLFTSFLCTSMFVGFGWVIGEMCGWSHTIGTWGFGCFLR